MPFRSSQVIRELQITTYDGFPPAEEKLVHDLYSYLKYFVAVTFDPLLLSDFISNSSIRRFTPGSPAPRPPEVEYPSSITLLTSSIPGPVSIAMIQMPF